MNYYKIGQKIREFRKINGLSQEQLAEKVNISTTHMSHIETGNTKLSLPVFVDLSKVLGVSTDELLGAKDKANQEICMDQIMSILNQCSEQEMKVITDIARSTKEAMNNHLKEIR